MFDSSPQVRLTLVRVVGEWLLDMPDRSDHSYCDCLEVSATNPRYSYWHKTVPLLLVSLSDEVSEVSGLAAAMWSKAGSKWLEENKMSDNRLKGGLKYL